MSLGERLQDRFEESKKEVENHTSKLQQLEDALNALDPTIVTEYRAMYEQRGGEQFRPDPTKFTCKWYFLVVF